MLLLVELLVAPWPALRLLLVAQSRRCCCWPETQIAGETMDIRYPFTST
jgi:hypothetical protein